MARHGLFAVTVALGLVAAAWADDDSPGPTGETATGATGNGSTGPTGSTTGGSGSLARSAAKRITPQELAEWIDARFAQEYERGGEQPAPLVDDATFLRRLYLDLQGRIPTVAQARDFVGDQGTLKRQNYVERLMSANERPDRFADRTSQHLSRVWRRMMVPASAPGAGLAVQLDPWLARQFAANTPYDQFARKLLLVSFQPPMPGVVPPQNQPADPDAAAAVFQQAVGPMPENLASAYVRVFLGVRLNCAQCHDHPFTDWKRADFWGVAALFSGDGSKPDESRPAPTIVADSNLGLTYTAKLLWSAEPLKEIPGGKSPREVLAEWMTSPENPNFAATAVNRTWQYLCGRGLAGSVDDLDRVSAGERRVLDDLAKLFVESGYDLRWLTVGICQSRTYQQSYRPEAAEEESFTHRPLKTLLPEQVFDSLEQALGLPVAKADNGPRFNGERAQFVSRMNESAAETPVDYKGGIPQALMLMNGKLTAEATNLDSSRTLRAVIEAPFLSTEEKIEALYLAALTRRPTEEEMVYLLNHVRQPSDDQERKQAYAQILWGLINSPEFVLSR
ncbi:MAG TPA: DUF1549 domain-containing protein [Pirellulales bacterium]|jgi:hypothetical protein|nr:DUF1549 domain-containing protein [Pirellulales bacterium]